MTERLQFHFSLSCAGEGNGNPPPCSCLENPRERGAWWAAVYGVAQSRTQLKWFSSSSSSSLDNSEPLWPHIDFDYMDLGRKSYGFSSSHIRMWEPDNKKGWAPNNWCFQNMVLEKILESPLDSKEIKPGNPKGNQPWIFIGKTDAEAEAPILWPPKGSTDSL